MLQAFGSASREHLSKKIECELSMRDAFLPAGLEIEEARKSNVTCSLCSGTLESARPGREPRGKTRNNKNFSVALECGFRSSHISRSPSVLKFPL